MAVKLTLEFICDESRVEEIKREITNSVPELSNITREHTKTLDELLLEMEKKIGTWTNE